jgi:hypothetical protein
MVVVAVRRVGAVVVGPGVQCRPPDGVDRDSHLLRGADGRRDDVVIAANTASSAPRGGDRVAVVVEVANLLVPGLLFVPGESEIRLTEASILGGVELLATLAHDVRPLGSRVTPSLCPLFSKGEV